MVLTLTEQRNILRKKVLAGSLSQSGMNSRLKFGKDILLVIKTLDSFINKSRSQLSAHELNDLRAFRRRLVSIREE